MPSNCKDILYIVFHFRVLNSVGVGLKPMPQMSSFFQSVGDMNCTCE